MFGCMPARDIILTVGNEMLEATMSYRCRWFEYLNYRPLIQNYYNLDPNMRHAKNFSLQPRKSLYLMLPDLEKPRLTDADYRKDYLSANNKNWITKRTKKII